MARLVGNGRNNRLEGTHESDRILGRGGDDRLFGRGDSDVLLGGSGNDRLVGGDDADTLVGGRGNDVLTGGSDGDRFVFRWGRDIITDFQPGVDDDDDSGNGDDDGDVIDLSALAGVHSFADIRAAAHQDGDDVVLRFDRDVQLTLLDVRWAALDREDFIF